MNFVKNKINSLLVGVFIVYWLFVLFIHFYDIPYIEAFKNSMTGQILVPPTYKMYTSPPKQIVTTHYTFYKNKSIVGEVDVDSLYHHQIKNEFPLPTVKRDVKQYLKVFYSPNVDLSNKAYKYAIDSVAQGEESLQRYIEKDKFHRINIENQINFAEVIRAKLSSLKSADSVKIVIKRRYNLIEMDPNRHNKFAYYMKDTIWIEKDKKL